MNSFGKCICDWMSSESKTAAQLAEMLGYRSKTTIFRMLHGKSNYSSCILFYKAILPVLDEKWQKRFQYALLSKKVGESRHLLMDALDHCLFHASTVPLSSHEKTDNPETPSAGGEVFIFGCPWADTFSRLEQWVNASDQIQVTHYVKRRDIDQSPDLLVGLISQITLMQYDAVMLEEADDNQELQMTWNLALWIHEKQAWILLAGSQHTNWHPLPGGSSEAKLFLSGISHFRQTPLYRCGDLGNGMDYITFTEENYRMERNRKVLIIKPCPGMQMLPAGIVEHTFKDFLEENLEPISAARETLIYTFEKRVSNFYHSSKHEFLILSRESMLQFARTGLLADHFFAFRPFTKEERIQIIRALSDLSKKETVSILFTENETWPVSVEAYDGYGVLFYPSDTNYNTSLSDYRELFLPGQDCSNLMFQYAEEYCFRDDNVNNEHNADAFFNVLLNMVVSV